jgi:energy-coupling factor transporter ATP-binding protein EcfA2
MKLVIKHLGSLQHAEIDLSKRFYLFTGYNNTGKTYVTKLLYQILSNKKFQEFTVPTHSEHDFTKPIELTKSLIENTLANFAQYIQNVGFPHALNVEKDHFILRNFKISFQYDEKQLFEKELETYIQYEVGNEQKIVLVYLHKPKNSWEVELKFRNIDEIKLDAQNLQIHNENLEYWTELAQNTAKNTFEYFLVTLLLQNQEYGFFLPAQRGFLLENANDILEQEQKRTKEMNKELVELINLFETNGDDFPHRKALNLLKNKYGNSYTTDTGELLDYISRLRTEKREQIIKGNKYYETYLQKMQDIMGGEIVMEKLHSLGNWTEKFKMQGVENQESINLYLASSSANQLALLFQFFKYWAKPERNFLMIDEPEINLHPENQIKVMNLLLSFAGEKNNRVLITTHSPLIGKVLNNYLIASKLGESHATIPTEEIGIYYFNGSIMNEYEIGDYGTTYTSFKLAQDNVFAEGEELSERMYQNLKPVF